MPTVFECIPSVGIAIATTRHILEWLFFISMLCNVVGTGYVIFNAIECYDKKKPLIILFVSISITLTILAVIYWIQDPRLPRLTWTDLATSVFGSYTIFTVSYFAMDTVYGHRWRHASLKITEWDKLDDSDVRTKTVIGEQLKLELEKMKLEKHKSYAKKYGDICTYINSYPKRIDMQESWASLLAGNEGEFARLHDLIDEQKTKLQELDGKYIAAIELNKESRDQISDLKMKVTEAEKKLGTAS